MSLVKCSKCNNYFDDEKSVSCPYCLSDASEFYENDECSKTEAYYDNTLNTGKTIGLFFQENDYDPVTGWIVCVKGTVRGKSYELHMNRNFLGRDKLMDITIPDDLEICRENHLSFTYDVKSNRFYVKNENGFVSVNGKNIDKATEIFDGDKIAFGESEYIFVPYCNKERRWDDE